MLDSHMLQYTYTCRIHIDAMKTSEDFFKKNIPLTLFERLCVRGSWRLNKDCNILTSPAPLDIAVCRSRSPGLLNRGPGGPASLGHVLIPASSHQLVSKLNRGSQRPLLPGGGFPYHVFSPTHLITNSLTSCRTELYNSSIGHSIFEIACLIVIKRK